MLSRYAPCHPIAYIRHLQSVCHRSPKKETGSCRSFLSVRNGSALRPPVLQLPSGFCINAFFLYKFRILPYYKNI